MTFLNPHFIPMMKEAITKMMPKIPNLPAGVDVPPNVFPFSDTYFRAMMAFGFLFAAAMLAVLIVYRKRFLEAARAKNSAAG